MEQHHVGSPQLASVCEGQGEEEELRRGDVMRVRSFKALEQSKAEVVDYWKDCYQEASLEVRHAHRQTDVKRKR